MAGEGGLPGSSGPNAEFSELIPSSFGASEGTLEWNEDGSISIKSEDGLACIPAERSQEVADAFYSGKQKFGKGRKKGDKGKGHPAGGDGKSVKNASGLKCHDCVSPYHLAGHPSCKHSSGYYHLAGHPSCEHSSGYYGFAGYAVELGDGADRHI